MIVLSKSWRIPFKLAACTCHLNSWRARKTKSGHTLWLGQCHVNVISTSWLARFPLATTTVVVPLAPKLWRMPTGQHKPITYRTVNANLLLDGRWCTVFRSSGSERVASDIWPTNSAAGQHVLCYLFSSATFFARASHGVPCHFGQQNNDITFWRSAVKNMYPGLLAQAGLMNEVQFQYSFICFLSTWCINQCTSDISKTSQAHCAS